MNNSPETKGSAVDRCVKCRHNAMTFAGDCGVQVPICSDGYHGTRRCGCHCEFPTKGSVVEAPTEQDYSAARVALDLGNDSDFVPFGYIKNKHRLDNVAKAIAAARVHQPDAAHERDLLAKGIAEAARKAGIYNAEVPLTGPQLIMLCDDLATAALPAPDVQAADEVQAAIDEAGKVGQLMDAADASGYKRAVADAENAVRDYFKYFPCTCMGRKDNSHSAVCPTVIQPDLLRALESLAASPVQADQVSGEYKAGMRDGQAVGFMARDVQADEVWDKAISAVNRALTFSDDIVDDAPLPFANLSLRDRALAALDRARNET